MVRLLEAGYRPPRGSEVLSRVESVVAQQPDERRIYCPDCKAVTAAGWCPDCGIDWGDGAADELRAENPHLSRRPTT